jgi:hypothetical protein
MSNPDAIPSWGDAVVVPVPRRDTRTAAPPPDRLGGQPPTTNDLDAMEARR